MIKRLQSLWVVLLLSSLPGLTPQAFAHHSFAMYNNTQQMKFTGKVTRFDWTNPHVYIEMTASQADGSTKKWTIECANISILGRIGWTFNMIKVGDQITVIVAPLNSGQPGALLKQVTLPDGRKMGNGNPAGPPDPKLVEG